MKTKRIAMLGFVCAGMIGAYAIQLGAQPKPRGKPTLQEVREAMPGQRAAAANETKSGLKLTGSDTVKSVCLKSPAVITARNQFNTCVDTCATNAVTQGVTPAELASCGDEMTPAQCAAKITQDRTNACANTTCAASKSAITNAWKQCIDCENSKAAVTQARNAANAQNSAVNKLKKQLAAAEALLEKRNQALAAKQNEQKTKCK